MSQLKVICLISGGKDSLFSMLHCLKHGHEIVALGNLHPLLPSHEQRRDDGMEEKDIDSFMYQTIGHSIIPLYEQALGIPLYREAIRGSAVNADRDYQVSSSQAAEDLASTEGTDEDETESLFRLLQRIMEQHPEANAVSAGAIMSAYQRTRIENVAGRLGLTPLAYLWQYPVLPQPSERTTEQKTYGLLEDMAACGCEARIVKVASGGLDSDMLWGNITSKDGVGRKALLKSIRSFYAMCGSEADSKNELEGAVLGEGGEYESLALDGPDFLWKQKIVVDEVTKVDGDGGSAFVRFKGAHCAPKDAAPEGELTLASVRRPELLDQVFQETLDKWDRQSEQVLWQVMPRWTTSKPPPIQMNGMENATLSHGDCFWSIANLRGNPSEKGAKAQMQSIAAKLIHTINYQNQTVPPGSMPSDRCTTGDVVFATVLLRNMSDFATVNEVYASLFTKPNPPARVAIACGDLMPEDCDVMCSFIFDEGDRRKRDGLHVQSRSYWAPANIGPYSQAISVPTRVNTSLAMGSCVYIAGQIPLDPPTMDLAWADAPSGVLSWFRPFISRATLSLQHLWRIAQATQVNWWMGAVAFLSGEQEIQKKAVSAYNLWWEMNDRPQRSSSIDDAMAEALLDAWDVKFGNLRNHLKPMEEATICKIPDWDINTSETPVGPPFIAVQVAALPRGSDIEWQALGARAKEVMIRTQEVKFASAIVPDADIRIVETVTIGGGVGMYCYIPETQTEEGLADALAAISAHIKRELGTAAPDCIPSDQTPYGVLYTKFAVMYNKWKFQVVPSRSVWDERGRPLAGALVVHMR